MVTAVQFIEKNYLGGKHLTKPTSSLIESVVRSYGDDAVLFFLRNDDRESYLSNKEYNNQKHFESVLVKMLRDSGYFIVGDYEYNKRLHEYDLQPEPPDVEVSVRNKKVDKGWVF